MLAGDNMNSNQSGKSLGYQLSPGKELVRLFEVFGNPLYPIKTSYLFGFKKKANAILKSYGYKDFDSLCPDSQQALYEQRVVVANIAHKERLGYIYGNSGMVVPPKIIGAKACLCEGAVLALPLQDLLASNSSCYIRMEDFSQIFPPAGFVELSCQVANSILINGAIIIEGNKGEPSYVHNSVLGKITAKGATLANCLILSPDIMNLANTPSGLPIFASGCILD